jgi:hypothetical protein
MEAAYDGRQIVGIGDQRSVVTQSEGASIVSGEPGGNGTKRIARLFTNSPGNHIQIKPNRVPLPGKIHVEMLG